MSAWTGWPAGLLQDYCRALSRWLASRPDSMRCAREAVENIERKVCTYCGQEGHRASHCPRRIAMSCTITIRCRDVTFTAKTTMTPTQVPAVFREDIEAGRCLSIIEASGRCTLFGPEFLRASVITIEPSTSAA